jgi:ATP-binding cassette, subfamily B, bacterial RamB/AmfA
MRREVRYGIAALRRRPALALAAWSVPEALPAALFGVAVAHAVDDGFLAGRPLVGLAWLAGFLLASGIGAAGSRQVFRRLGELVEPVRDDLVRRVVGGALRGSVAGRTESGALARLTRQVEVVRDTYAGLIVIVRGFLVTVVGVVIGLLSVAPVVALLILPAFLLGFALFLATLGMAAARQRAAVLADERLAAAAGAVLAGTRDVVATGTEEHAARRVARPIGEQAAAEQALAWVAALRTLCFAIGGWVPLLTLLFAGPWLVRQGLSAGAIMGGLTYVLFGLQPALRNVISGLGGSGLRFVVTLSRILDASAPPVLDARRAAVAPVSHDLILRGVTFAYGPHAEPVLKNLDLSVPKGDHLALVGPSGIGKSTLAGLLCGLLRPDAGMVALGGTAAVELPAARLAELRVLIPQEAYVFAGSVWDNFTYLRQDATRAQVYHAVAAVGADTLVARLGGCSVELVPAELSAGERQLVALVRAYLSPAPVVVLDEATCHLDPAAERCAEQAFADRGGTLIVIAHRISSALRARRILVLDGECAIVGDNRTLLATSPLYREMLGHWQVGLAAESVDRPAPASWPDYGVEPFPWKGSDQFLGRATDGIVMIREDGSSRHWSSGGRRRMQTTEVGHTGARFEPVSIRGPDAHEAEVGHGRHARYGEDRVESTPPDTGIGRTGARFGPYSARWRRRDKPAEPPAMVAPPPGPDHEEIVRAAAAPGPRDGDHPDGRLPSESDVLIRPYARTGGRTRSAHDLALESLISTSPRGAATAGRHPSREHRAIATLCVRPRSVAEVAALLSIPLGVARVLLADMATDGTVVVHGATGRQPPDLALMQRVLTGLHRL